MGSESVVDVLVFSSSVYWTSEKELADFYCELISEIISHIGCVPGDLNFTLVGLSAQIPASLSDGAYFFPLSGGVQPLMLQAAENYDHIGLINGYLKDFLSDSLSKKIMLLNGHPSCTDFFAFQKQADKSIFWLSSREKLQAFFRAWQGSLSLKKATILKVGETEPWVINSCRKPEVYKTRLGTTVIPVASEVIYEKSAAISDERALLVAEDFIKDSTALIGVDKSDIIKAARVVVALEDLLKERRAQGLSMACFAMIGVINTTSCLALSYLNDSLNYVGACEGDLEAAVTLHLIEALGGEFGWIANPIVYDDNYLDLSHCTAPRCIGKRKLDYAMLRHHETGAGVATQVNLPGDERVSLIRIGGDLDRISCFTGTSERVEKQGTCHTQIRVHIDSSERFLDSMTGTHQILCYGDLSLQIKYAAAFLGLNLVR